MNPSFENMTPQRSKSPPRSDGEGVPHSSPALEPHDRSALRPSAAGPLASSENLAHDSTPAVASEAREWARAHPIVRALMVAEEACRLYPVGHGRTRSALKAALGRIQEHATTCGRAFSFAPEAMLECIAGEKSRAAKDLSAFAYVCRSHLVRHLSIEDSVDLDELEELVRFLQTNADSREAQLGRQAGMARARAWRAIRVEFYEGEDDREGYAFNDAGEQLFPTASAGGDSAPFPDSVPAPIQRLLTGVFARPEVQSSLSALARQLGVKGLVASPGRGDPDQVDLVQELVAHLFGDPTFALEASPDAVEQKMIELIAFLERVAHTLPDRGDDATPGAERITELLRRAAGLHRPDEPGLPELFRQSERLRTLFESPESLGTRDGPSRPPAHTSTGVGSMPDRPAREPAPRRPQTHAAPSGFRASAEPGSARIDPSQRACRPPLFDDMLAIPVDPAGLANALVERDWRLEALRVELEILVSESDIDRYRRGRNRWIDSACARDWKSADEFLAELDSAALLVTRQPLDCALEFAEAALSRHPDQEVVNRYFEQRVDRGVEINTLRPVLEAIATSDRMRSLSALTYLWKKAPKERRESFLDEVFTLTLSVEELAEWGVQHPQAFASTHAQRRLAALSTRELEELLKRFLGSNSSSRRIGDATAAIAIVRALGGREDAERVLKIALRRGGRALQHEALSALGAPSSPETLATLESLLRRANEQSQADLDSVRLILTALLRSQRPRAREILQLVRSERRALRHVYRREIREILEILRQVEGPEA